MAEDKPALRIFEKLRKIIDIKNLLKFEGKLVLFDFSRNIENKYQLEGDKKLIINPSKLGLTDDKKKALAELFSSEIKDGNVILQKEYIQETRDLKQNIPTGEDKVLLDFYKDKLKPEYVDALEICLMIRTMSKKGIDIDKNKRDVIKKYPKFGRNICNMVSADYFHNHFKELYEHMKDDNDFTVELYQQKVERIVISLPYTVFINSKSTSEEKLKEIVYKMEKLKKYGTGRLIIHGLGTLNVNKSEEIIKYFEKDSSVDIEIPDKSKTYITAILKF